MEYFPSKVWQSVAVFTWARITFRKMFRIVIQNVIGIVIELRAFTCIANAFPITIRICALRGNILLLLRSPRALIDPCTNAWLQRAFLKCTRTNHVPKELCFHMHVLESGFLGGSQSKTPFFSRFKTCFKSLI